MSDSNAITGEHTPAEGDHEPATVGWHTAPAVWDRTEPSQPTRAAPAASTPGPHAPERITHADSTANPTARRPLPQLPPIPGYEVLRFIGRGGMGVVYEAVHTATGRTVALKLVNPSGAQDHVTRERFAREVHALASLKHPNIVPVYDAGDWHGFPYCAMEYVPGGTLSAHLDRVRTDLPGAMRLMAKVCRAVAALHAAGVLHRDLKPLNILLGENDEPMVADFGLVRWEDDESDLTNTGLPVGTRLYMAPEQTLGRRTDYTPACDIWALGVTLFEVLSGQRPFTDDGMTDVSNRIRFDAPPRMAELAPEVPAALEAIAFKCLEKRPEDRYATAVAVAEDLERWLAGEAVQAPAVPVPQPAAAPQAAAPQAAATKRSTPRRVYFFAVTVAVLLAVGVAWATGAFRSRNEAAPPPKRTLAQRVADGEKVKLTDDLGFPLEPWTPVAGHPLATSEYLGYHKFSCKGPGIAQFSDEEWTSPLLVEADVGMTWESSATARGGLFVGRKSWIDPQMDTESFVFIGFGPREPNDKPPKFQFAGLAEAFWTVKNLPSVPIRHDDARKGWSADNNMANLRFAHVVVEVRETEIRGTVDGVKLKTIDQKWMLQELNAKIKDLRQLPPQAYTPSAFGTGLGVFCFDATNCVVRNLTVSKLTP